jgi:hypothetical protein
MESKSLTWLQPALYGAACGAVAVAIIGFQWGGWVTGGTAKALASSQTQSEVVSVLTPLCLDLAKSDPEFTTKMLEIKKASSYTRSELVVKAGWGTKLGSDNVNKLVARTCADKLLL